VASPVHRLTIIVDGQRNLAQTFSPSAAGMFRLLGTGTDDVTIAALGKFKVDGFAGGPSHDEVESEIELGALLSYATAGWHLDLNAIGGRDWVMKGKWTPRVDSALVATWGRGFASASMVKHAFAFRAAKISRTAESGILQSDRKPWLVPATSSAH